MKVLQVNTVSGYGSTGRICVELAEGLIANGHQAYIAFSHGSSSFPNSYRFGYTLEQKTHALLSRITGLQGYFSPRGTQDLMKWIKYEKPDIVHLHNLHSNNVNLIQLLYFLAESKIATVLSLHDCWFFTGKCTHYTDENCRKWETQCFKCPRIRKDNVSYFFDRTPKMYRDKREAFGTLEKLALIGVSDWITNEAKKSFLKDAKIIERIYNWIDQTVFKLAESDVRKKYKIPDENAIVLGVSAIWTKNDRKYQGYLRLAGLLPENVNLVLVGNMRGISNFPANIINVPYVYSTSELAEIYSIADVYVHLSTEDTFGKVIAEAMACGTPVVVFNSTACPEIVSDGCGYVVDKSNILEVFKVVNSILIKGKHTYSEKCIQHVAENFNYEKQIRKTIKIYEKILDHGL